LSSASALTFDAASRHESESASGKANPPNRPELTQIKTRSRNSAHTSFRYFGGRVAEIYG